MFRITFFSDTSLSHVFHALARLISLNASFIFILLKPCWSGIPCVPIVGKTPLPLQMGNKNTSKKTSCLWPHRSCVVVQELELVCPELLAGVEMKVLPPPEGVGEEAQPKRHSAKTGWVTWVWGTQWSTALPSQPCWSLLDCGKQKGFVVIST